MTSPHKVLNRWLARNPDLDEVQRLGETLVRLVEHSRRRAAAPAHSSPPSGASARGQTGSKQSPERRRR